MESRPGVYTPLGTDGNELCHPINPADFERINTLINGTARQAGWKPIRMQIIREDEGKNLSYSDSPWLGSHALIFRSSVLETTSLLLERYGEVLPVSCPDVDLWVFNPTTVVDALDDEASSVLRFGDGKIMMIERYVFQAEMIADNDVFKTPSLRVSPTFVNHRFVDRWKESGLTGLEFKQVWTAQNS